jgi:hypothetical protein
MAINPNEITWDNTPNINIKDIVWDNPSQIDFSIPTEKALRTSSVKPQAIINQPQTSLEKTLGPNIYGGAETAKSLIAAPFYNLIGNIAGVGKEVLTGNFGKGTAEKVSQQVMGAMPMPYTQQGKQQLESLSTSLEGSKLSGLGPNYAPNVAPLMSGVRNLSIGKQPIKIPGTNIDINIPTVEANLFKKERVPLDNAPTKDFLETQSNQLFQSAKDAGITYKTKPFNSAMSNIATGLREEGYTPTAYPKVSAAINELTANPLPKDFTELKALRTIIKGASSSADAAERRIAGILLDKFDDYVINSPTKDIKVGSKEGVQLWQEARSTYSKLKKSEVFDDMLSNADLNKSKFTQSGVENALATELRNLAKNDKRMRLFTKEEQSQIRAAAKGGNLQNTLKFIGRFSPTGPVSGIFSGGAIAYNPFIGVPVALGALASRYGATKMRQGGVENLSKFMRQGGPAYQINPTRAAQGATIPLETLQYGSPTGLLSDYLNQENK